LCPKSASSIVQHALSQCVGNGEPEPEEPRIAEFDEAEKCLDEASMRRTEALKEVELALESQGRSADGKFQEIAMEVILPNGLCSKDPLFNFPGRENNFKSSILTIVWEILDNSFSMVILQKVSVRDFSLKLVAAATYEEALGDVSDELYLCLRCSLLMRMHSPL
jgi:hypothetical protein